MSLTKIGILGCAGRMGRMILKVAAESGSCRVAAGCDRPDSPLIGQDLGVLAGGAPSGASLGAAPDEVFAASEVVIDFTAPAATAGHAALAAQHGTALIVGTTGLGAAEMQALAAAAERVAVVQAANTSLGVTLLQAIVEQVARSLAPEDFDIEVLEMHHRHKVDAPSGTALLLGRAAASGRGVALEAVAKRVRDGITGPRPAGEIGFATLRGGSVTGEHAVIFAGEAEIVEIAHRTSSREVFARGALKAAAWLKGRPAGLYSMKDVLGLS